MKKSVDTDSDVGGEQVDPPAAGTESVIPDHGGKMRLPRSRGAVSGVVLVLLGLWGALAPFIGPYFHFAFTPRPTETWHWTAGRGWFEVLPGAIAFVGGLLLVVSTSRLLTSLGAWIAAVAGGWFVVGPQVSLILTIGSPGQPSAAGDRRYLAEELSFFTGLGAIIVLFAAIAIGRLSVRSVRDVKVAARRDEQTALAEQGAAEQEAAERAEADRVEAERAEAERAAANQEAIEQESAARQAAERQTAEREAAERDAAEREAAEREAAERDAAGRTATELPAPAPESEPAGATAYAPVGFEKPAPAAEPFPPLEPPAAAAAQPLPPLDPPVNAQSSAAAVTDHGFPARDAWNPDGQRPTDTGELPALSDASSEPSPAADASTSDKPRSSSAQRPRRYYGATMPAPPAEPVTTPEQQTSPAPVGERDVVRADDDLDPDLELDESSTQSR